MSTLLTYDLMTNPDPLQINYSNAKLTVIASYPGRGAAAVGQIQVNIPFGTGSASLCLSSSEITVATPAGWIQQDGSGADGQFIFVPVDAGGVVGGLAFVFSGLNINTTLGTATVSITEGSTGGRYQSVDLPVSKFPAEFSLGALVANPANVAAGLTSVLSWDGSPGYNYSLSPVELLPGQIPTNRNLGSITTLPLTQNAVFTLTVTNGGGSEPFVTSRSVGVTVAPPKVDSFTLNGHTAGVTCDLGATLTFGWQVSNADHVLLMAGNIAVGFFSADLGEVAVTCDRKATYWIVAYFGAIQLGVHSPPSDGINVTLNPPQILSFTSTMPNVFADYDATAMALNWTVKNATSLTLQLGSDQGSFPVPISTTSYQISPDASTTYTLTATYDPDEVPASPVVAPINTASLALATESTPAKTTVSASTNVRFSPCPMDITLHSFTPGSTWTRNLNHPIAAIAWGIAGFDYRFADGGKHNLYNLLADATTTVGGQSFTMTPSMILSNDSGKNISSSSTLKMMSFTLYEGNEGAGAGVMPQLDWHNMSVTLAGSNFASATAVLSAISLSHQSSQDGQIKSLSAAAGSGPMTVNTSTDQTVVAVSGWASASGQQNYNGNIKAGVLGLRTAPEGSGFAIKVVDQGTATVNFEHPVASAYTMLTSWSDSGNGDNHTISQLLCDYVTPTCNSTKQVSLDWGQSYWDDGTKNGRWNATRQIIVIAAYGTSR